MSADLQKHDLENVKTRQRLLEVAGAVFAEHGFKNATVREICSRAGANVAAINYHFGDKQGLYSETLRYWARESLAKYPPNLGVDESATPQQKLHAYVRSFLWRILDEGRPAWYGRLIAREMFDPTHALDERVEETMRPIANLLMSVVRQLIPGASDTQVRQSACSIVGQIVVYHHCRSVLPKLYPGQCFGPDDIEQLARHITDFSLGGLQKISQQTKTL